MYYDLTLATDRNLILISLEQQLHKSKLSSTLKYQFTGNYIPHSMSVTCTTFYQFKSSTPLPSRFWLPFQSFKRNLPRLAVAHKPHLAMQKSLVRRAENAIGHLLTACTENKAGNTSRTRKKKLDETSSLLAKAYQNIPHNIHKL